jgi:uncharacterized 2Fe-2S/4Fe-4S cluster protein (DUF4445 family)
VESIRTIFLKPGGEKVKARDGENLFFALVSAGIPIRGECGGKGICGRCRVRFVKNAPPPTELEKRFFSLYELDEGWRLACQHVIEKDVSLWIPFFGETFEKKIAKLPGSVPFSPKAAFIYVEVPFSERSREGSKIENLKAALGENIGISLSVLQELPQALKEGKGKVTLIQVGKKVVTLRPGHRAIPLLGLAVDLGTSTLAAYLLDLHKGVELGEKAIANPQLSFGADVLSRIAYVHEKGKEGLERLREAVIEGVNRLVAELCSKARVATDEIVHIVVVGNPTMLHLFLGVDPTPIGEAPFKPVWREVLSLRAKELNLRMVHPRAVVEVPPLISGYVGADTVACILACRLHEKESPCLLLDLGTNGEIVLGWKERLLTCSAAAGPAFEGGRISCGMPALKGAISHVHLTQGSLNFKVIGGIDPLGICGSGLVDLLALLLEEGLVDATGRFSFRPDHPLFSRVIGCGNNAKFLVAKGIYLTQRDIRELQLAKAAIRAGIELLLDKAGLSPQEIHCVYLAGTFGSEMRPQALVKIGLLPTGLLPKVQPIGNAAASGAIIMLLNKSAFKEAIFVAKKAEYVELSSEKQFVKKFVANMRFT